MATSHVEVTPAAAPFVAIGCAAVVAGGIAAAVTGPTDWDHGSWVAAFLVLVAGVGQIGLGFGQQLVSAPPPPTRRVVTEVACFNCSAAMVIAGTLLTQPALVTAGGLVLVGALVCFAWAARTSDAHTWVRRTYAGLLLLLIGSTPIGLAVAWLRA